MNTPARNRPLRHLRPTLLALAILSAYGFASADDNILQATVTGGAGIASGDSADRGLFGQYNGLRNQSATGLLDLDYERRDTKAGTGLRVEGSRLLGPTRELDLRWKKQGDWKATLDYQEKVRHDPLDVSNGADLKIERTGLGLGLVKTINERVQVDVKLSSENREGSRLFGIGMNCPSAVAPGCTGTSGIEAGWAVLMLPEPIKTNHSQVEARVSYAGEKLMLSAGYYGSFFRNEVDRIDPTVPATLNNALGTPLPVGAGLATILGQPVALAPDNQAHQIDITGTYAFTAKTHLNFKLGYGQLIQNQDFAAAGFTDGPAGVSNLGARVDTKLAQVTLTARPLEKLSLLAKVRYDDRDDKTPVALYNIEGTSTYTNRQLPNTKIRTQWQASYQLSSDYRGTLAAETESIDRGVFTSTSAVAGISALRQKTDETTLRAELRRRVTETFSGAVSVASSRRDGSNWLRNNSGTGVTEVPDPTDPAAAFSTAVFMPTLADRKRDSFKISGNWQPSEKIGLQLSGQHGRDRYDTPSAYGLRHSGMDLLSFDASYAYSDRWRYNAFVTYGEESLLQARAAATILSFANRTTNVGVGFTGNPHSKFDLGGSLSFIEDSSIYDQTLDATADGASAALLAATGGLPDIVFRQATLKLFGRYTIDKRSSVRVDLVQQHSHWNDWTWAYNGVPFTYSDGTIVSRQPVQNVTFVGLTYSYSWR